MGDARTAARPAPESAITLDVLVQSWARHLRAANLSPRIPQREGVGAPRAHEVAGETVAGQHPDPVHVPADRCPHGEVRAQPRRALRPAMATRQVRVAHACAFSAATPGAQPARNL